MRSLLKSIAIGATALALAPAVHAQATRTRVSGVGDDANPCSRTAPCKTFAGAISKTAVNGLIDVLDPGGFGAVTITKNITIEGYDMQAGVLVSGTNAINVSGAGIKVTLRNLSIEGITTGLSGVNFIQGAELIVEKCRIFGFQSGAATGINANISGSAQLVIKDTMIHDNGTGVFLSTNSGQLLVTLDNVNIDASSQHALSTGGAGQVFALVKRSTLNHSALDGVHAGSASSVVTVVDSSLAFNNGTALNAAVAGAHIRASGNAIFNNAGGLGVAPGALMDSDGTNRIAGFNTSAAPNGVLAQQ
jgi:hypothetical protein